MEENNKNVSEIEMDGEEIKEYMELVHNFFQKMIDSYEGEKSKKEIWEEFLEYFEEDSFKKAIGREFFYDYFKLQTYKEFLKETRGKKQNSYLNKLINTAKQMENKDNRGVVNLPLNGTKDDRIISLIRAILRSNGNVPYNTIVEIAKKGKTNMQEKVVNALIERIQQCVISLEDYGILDRNINDCNKVFEELGLDNLKFIKRNPLADEYGENESSHEDIGVLDSFDEKILRDKKIDDLVLLDTFWESQYLMEKMKLAKAIKVIDDMADFGKKDIPARIPDADIMIEDIISMQDLIMQLLYTKQMDVRQWGIVGNIENKQENVSVIAINNGRYRGPIVMSIGTRILEQMLDVKEEELPEYMGYLSEEYSEIMSKILMFSNEYFKEEAKKSMMRENEKPGVKNNKLLKTYNLIAGKKVPRDEEEEKEKE